MTSLSTRLAWREMCSHWLRTLLVVAMLALPSMLIVGVGVVGATTIPSRSEAVTLYASSAHTVLVAGTTPSCGHNGRAATLESVDQIPCDAPISEKSRAELLASASALGRPTVIVDYFTPPTVEGQYGMPIASAVRRVASLNDLSHPMVDIVEGRAPRAPHEVLSTGGIPAQYELGDQIRVGEITLTVVGLTRNTGADGPTIITILPGSTLVPLLDKTPATQVLVGGTPLSAQETQRLETQGVAAWQPSMLQTRSSLGPSELWWQVITLPVLALLAVVVITTASGAMAVGTAQRRRHLRLLEVTGASPRTLARLSRREASLCAVGGWLLGSLAGMGIAIALMKTGTVGSAFRHIPVHLPAVTIPLAGVATWLCAWAASVSASRGARVNARHSRRRGVIWAAVGVAALVLLLASPMLIYSGSPLGGVTLPLALMLLLLAIARNLTWIVDLVAHIPRLPLALRLATRDARRSRERTGPSLGSVAMMVVAALLAINGTSFWFWNIRSSAPIPSTEVALLRASSTVRADDVVAAAQPIVPVRAAVELREMMLAPYAGENAEQTPPPLIVSTGGPTELAYVLGRTPTPAEASALEAGTMLVADASLVHDGHVTVEYYVEETGARKTQDYPAMTVTGGLAPGTGFASTAFADRLAAEHPAEPIDHNIRARLAHVPTYAEGLRLASAIGTIDSMASTSVAAIPPWWSGVESWLLTVPAMLLVLLVGALAAALAMVDTFEDQRLLHAVGADPRMRRRMGAAHMAVIVGIGCLVGTAVGLCLAVFETLVMSAFQLPFSMLLESLPWREAITLMLVTPLVGAGIGWVMAPHLRTNAPR